MTPQSEKTRLSWALIQAIFPIKHQMMLLAEEYDITGVQLYALCSLEPGSPIPMNRLSCLLSCDASNVTGIVDRLLAQQHITREEDPTDRRVRMITLTPKGEELRQVIFRELAQRETTGLNMLSPDQRQQLYEILITMIDTSRTARS